MADAEEVGNGLLARWSERKLRARRGVELDAPATDTVAVPQAATEPDEARVLADADMPPLESLDDGSDYSGFLSPGVSEDLRRKALSKLFHGARFNIADGLDDYAEDFTGFPPLGDIVTSDMRHRMEEAAKRLLAGEEEAVEVDEVTGEAAHADLVVAPSEPPASCEGEPRAEGEPT